MPVLRVKALQNENPEILENLNVRMITDLNCKTFGFKSTTYNPNSIQK